MRLKKKRRMRGGSRGGDIAIFAVLFIIGLFMLFPIYFSIIQSLKPSEELYLFPPRLYVQRPTLQSFSDMLKVAGGLDVPFTRYVFNSVFTSVSITLLQVAFTSSAAYVLAKVKAPGIKALNKIIEVSLLFTSSVTYIVQYIVMSKIGIINTPAALILPLAATPIGLFLMRQFMSQVPDTLIESAKIDGASHFRICWQIVMPNVKPAWLTLIIFAFQGSWQTNGYLFVFSEELKPLPVVMQQIAASGMQRAGISYAIVVVMMLPPMILFMCLQSNVVETMAHSGLKD